MYEKPHNKILGRTLSHRPEEGIPIALQTLSDPESHHDDYVMSACYMAYRALDKTFDDVDFAWNHLCKAKELVDSFSIGNRAPWYVARWHSSIKIAKIYMRICSLNQKTPLTELIHLANADYCILHPPQVVNTLRANSMLIMDMYVREQSDKCEEQIYGCVIPTFQKAMMLYKPVKDYSFGVNMAAEMHEATECLVFIMSMRNLFNGPISESIYEFQGMISKRKAIKSYGIYYEALEKIFNQISL